MSALDLAVYLRKRLQALELTTVEAAKRSGISRQTWQKLLAADIDEAKLSTLMKVSDTLEVHTLNMLKIYFHGKTLTHASAEHSGTKQFASGFIKDVTYPDNSLVHVGEIFEKAWEVVNLGTEPWDGWHLQCIDDCLEVSTKSGKEASKGTACQYGLIPLQSRIAIPYTLPGEHVRLAVRFRAPDLPCSVVSHWKTVDASGVQMFPHLTGLYCMVKVTSV